MMMGSFLQVVALLTLTAQAAAPAPSSKEAAAEIARLIELLRSNDLPVREAATEKLETMGSPALHPLLQLAAADKDPVVVYRANRLVSRITESIAREDLKQIHGKWTLIRAAHRGEERKKAAGGSEVDVVNGILTLKVDGEEPFGGFLELGWADGRKTFDVFGRGAPDKLFLLRGIYDLTGDTLTLCWSTSREGHLPRPAKLESMKSPASFLAVYKRAKD